MAYDSTRMIGDEVGPDYDQTYWTYKIMIMPDDMLASILAHEKNIQVLKLIYRKLSLLIHPDKNEHPMSSGAFMKLYKAYESLKEKLLSSITVNA